jgi:DNA-binding NtrC family response regulator
MSAYTMLVIDQIHKTDRCGLARWNKAVIADTFANTTVRKLRNVIERSLILHPGQVFEVELPESICTTPSAGATTVVIGEYEGLEARQNAGVETNYT